MALAVPLLMIEPAPMKAEVKERRHSSCASNDPRALAWFVWVTVSVSVGVVCAQCAIGCVKVRFGAWT
eukprot:6202911-Pleurochrysis_carterae.AAC.1